MIWNKRKKSVVAIYIIVAVVYALLGAVIPVLHESATSWIVYGFTILSILAGMFITLFAFSKEETLISKFYGFPVFRIGEVYTATQIIVSIVICILDYFFDIPYWIGLGISILLLGATAVGVIAADNSRDYIEEIDAKEKSSTRTMTILQNEIVEIYELCKNEEAKDQLQKLVVKFKYSDPVSTSKSKIVEVDLSEELQKLERLVLGNDAEETLKQVDAVSQLLSSRNRICELSK